MLFFESMGDKRLPLLVFLHGFLGSRQDFFPLMEKLQGEFHCVSLDLPAHGKSPYSPPFLPVVADTIRQLSTSLQQAPFLIGYSLGGRTALQLSATLTLRGLVILSAHPGLSSSQEKKQRLLVDLAWKEKLETLPPHQFLQLWYEQPVFSSLHRKPNLKNLLIEKKSYTNALEKGKVLEEMSLSHQILQKLPLQIPSLFLLGEEDIPYKVLYQNLGIPASIITQAGHTLLAENPSACLEEIQSFVQKQTVLIYS